MTLKQLERELFKLKRRLNADEGIIHGNAKSEVGKICVAWMADLAAINFAHKNKADVIICHEALFYPYPFGGKIRRGFSRWKVNRLRKDALDQFKIGVIRFHGTLDEICIFDDFAKKLGLLKPAVDKKGFVKLYDIKPAPLEKIVKKVKKRLGLQRIRVSPYKKGRIIRRIGLPWGGLGLFVNVNYQEALIKEGAELFIAGEVDSYTYHFAIDAGLVIIETGHELSENFGLKKSVYLLKNKLSPIPVIFYENKTPWKYQ